MSRVVEWDPAEHAALLVGWMRARDMGDDAAFAMALRLLPPTGFVADNIAAAFLFRTDALQAYVGGVISDPATTREDRREALAVLFDTLEERARKDGYEALSGLPTVPSLAMMFAERGYVLAPGHYAIRRL